ncbi:spore germination cell wall hydrolase CwlJ-like protein [Azospirillum lipoferum]|uniref:Cell wall hydrolase n=1 Tax=Azospirillum lipoferum TaxID=193 RepID=A0A5A9GAK4_AZOLI|nr:MULTISPECIES: cell wall hydrolase [Azospirillum]KAA0590299.1 cell wall hydrolase [Azospirillum lipoferum]MCP1614944.1 spore germination cell wall hydrolase CwlJ-like protein [Azospirillum lipoferum]MDW5532510.1 cell wall hydrolase [Azospirillum sp. NL1]
MRNFLTTLLLATVLLPAGAKAQAAADAIDAATAAVCQPGDTGCARFVGDEKGAVPKRGGAKQPVMIGASVFMLTPWQAERERRCLALAGWAEARGEGADAMAAVMWVVANRAASADQPSLPCRVVVASGQFEPFAVEPVEPKNRQKAKAAKSKGKPKRTAAEQAALAADPRTENKRILAEIRRQAAVIRAGGMPSWPKLRLVPDQEALRVARGLAWNLNDDDMPDPTARASLFYSPPAQAALRRQKPDWAEARLLTTSIGGHSFYRYPTPPEERTIATLVAEIGE